MRRRVVGVLSAFVLVAASIPRVASAEPDVAVGLGGNEPTAGAVNPLDPQNVVLAQCTLAISNDFGRTFPITVNPPVPPGYPSTGIGCDDVLTFDSQGRLFWVYLLRAAGDLTVAAAQINPTTGAVIGNAVDITPGNFSDDKPWIVADSNLASGGRDNLYIVWTRGPSIPCNPPNCAVYFSRSLNNGATFSAPNQISAAGDGFVWPSHVAVGPNGDVFAAFHSDTCGAANANMVVLRDSNYGADLAGGAGTIQRTTFPAAVTCNVQDGSGDEIPNTIFWMQGALAPYVIPDPVRPNNIYVVANDDPNDNFGTGDGGDVVVARSTNNGATWTKTTVSHGPAGSLQVFPIGAIDQDGRLAIHWWDTRRGNTNAAGNLLLDSYATVSVDGGLTFTNDFLISDAAFDPDLGAPCRFGPQPPCGGPGGTGTFRIGEYNGIAAADGIGYATWTGNTATGQQVLFDVFSISGAIADRFEPNNARNAGVATDLGAHATYSESDLTIHNELDEDFFRVTALATGKLRVQITSTGRISDLDVQVQDQYGNAVATGTAGVDNNDTEAVVIPVVSGEVYFVRVFPAPGAPSTQTAPQNVYDLNVVNTAAPVPFDVTLQPGSDHGWYPNDNVTNTANPSIVVLVDSNALTGLTLSPTPDANLADDAPGYKIAVYVNGALDGYATAGPGPGSFLYTISGAPPMVQGLDFITARVIIVDPSDDPAVGGTAHVTGQGAASGALFVTLDTDAPAPPSAPDLLASSDSGMSNTDNVTNIIAPAFEGTGEVNTRVRILANGVLIGEGLVGSDATDGILGNGLGHWEVTVEPLTDGVYVINAVVEDLAGNISNPSAPMAGGDLVIDSSTNGTPQRPTLDLLSADDTGRSDQDNVTFATSQRVRVSAEVGTTVVIKDGNTVIDTWVQAAAFDERTLGLAEGPHPLSAESTDAAGNRSHQSEELFVVVDTTAPTTPAAPDLLASSDTGGIDDDNVTTLRQPHFAGTGEPNALARLYAGAPQVGSGVLNSSGQYDIGTSSLSDGVYQVTVRYEDLAGNLSTSSGAVKVTIAHDSLTLPGQTASGVPVGPVTVDLAAGTVDGYPGIAGATGMVGVIGIPVVNLSAAGSPLVFVGTGGDDDLTYTPATASSGRVERTGVAQIFDVTNVAQLTIDPLDGSDVVNVIGTAGNDTVTVDVDLTMVTQFGAKLAVGTPNATTERVAVSTLAGQDTITVNATDTVNALVSVDGGDPAPAPKQKGDRLTLFGASPRPFLGNAPGGPTPGSGVATVSYKQTTQNITRVDYRDIESVKLTK